MKVRSRMVVRLYAETWHDLGMHAKAVDVLENVKSVSITLRHRISEKSYDAEVRLYDTEDV